MSDLDRDVRAMLRDSGYADRTLCDKATELLSLKDAEIERLRDENRKLLSMCKAAAVEILGNAVEILGEWDAHSDLEKKQGGE